MWWPNWRASTQLQSTWLWRVFSGDMRKAKSSEGTYEWPGQRSSCPLGSAAPDRSVGSTWSAVGWSEDGHRRDSVSAGELDRFQVIARLNLNRSAWWRFGTWVLTVLWEIVRQPNFTPHFLFCQTFLILQQNIPKGKRFKKKGEDKSWMVFVPYLKWWKCSHAALICIIVLAKRTSVHSPSLRFHYLDSILLNGWEHVSGLGKVFPRLPFTLLNHIPSPYHTGIMLCVCVRARVCVRAHDAKAGSVQLARLPISSTGGAPAWVFISQ